MAWLWDSQLAECIPQVLATSPWLRLPKQRSGPSRGALQCRNRAIGHLLSGGLLPGADRQVRPVRYTQSIMRAAQLPNGTDPDLRSAGLLIPGHHRGRQEVPWSRMYARPAGGVWESNFGICVCQAPSLIVECFFFIIILSEKPHETSTISRFAKNHFSENDFLLSHGLRQFIVLLFFNYEWQLLFSGTSVDDCMIVLFNVH